MRIFYIILLIIAIIAAVVFAVQNSTPITVAFFGLTAQASMSIVLVVTFAAGILLGMFLLLPSIWKRMRALSAQKKKTRHFERQLKDAATVPDAASGQAPAAETGSGDSVSATIVPDSEKTSKGSQG